MAVIKCPKCGYIATNQSDDQPTDAACPKCGIIYAKFAAERTAIAARESAQEKKTYNSNLSWCDACGQQHSPQAQHCPHCGHPNPDAPRTAGMIAGIIAIQLGSMSTLLPYFAIVFLVPATFAAAGITALLRLRSVAIVAALMASFELYNIYQISKEIRAAGTHAESQYRDAVREAERINKQLDREMQKYRGY